MYLRCNRRIKDGKEHRYWNIVESKRCAGGKVVQRQVLYLGEINDSQRQSWCRVIEAFDEQTQQRTQLALFPAEKELPEYAEGYGIQVRLEAMELCRPRQFGACWLACHLYEQLALDQFWKDRLPDSREGNCWQHVVQTLVCYRLIDPGSEWRLHQLWFDTSAMGDLLGEDYSLVEKNTLYRCLDKVLEHKQALFSHLTERWQGLFGAKFDVLLYDLTSTYFESSGPADENDKRRYGYSRDKRSDCVQVVIALVVTPEGFPLAYEVLAGNTSDRTTLREFLNKIETQYGKAERIWVMDRGIPTEEVLTEMRHSNPPIKYLVGTPRGRLTRLEKQLVDKPWRSARPGVEVKLLAQQGELYVLAESRDRIAKERSMRRRRLKWLWARLKQLSAMTLTREDLLMKLGAAKQTAPSAWRLIKIEVAKPGASFTYRLHREKLRRARRREGRYLLRTNLTESDPAKLWSLYLQVVAVEEAFKNLKGDLAVRPIFHQNEKRVEAHIFVSFLAYCLHVTLGQRLRSLAPGLTTRSVLEQFAAMQMIDVHLPTTDGRQIILTRTTQPEPELKLLLDKLKLQLPAQLPPKISAAQATSATAL